VDHGIKLVVALYNLKYLFPLKIFNWKINLAKQIHYTKGKLAFVKLFLDLIKLIVPLFKSILYF